MEMTSASWQREKTPFCLPLNLQIDICNPTKVPEIQASVHLKPGALEHIGEVGVHRCSLAAAAAPPNTAGDKLGCIPHTMAQKRVRNAEAALVSKNLPSSPLPLQQSLVAPAKKLGTSQRCCWPLETGGNTVGLWPWLPPTPRLRGPRHSWYTHHDFQGTSSAGNKKQKPLSTC